MNEIFLDLIHHLRADLNASLPGFEVQMRMAPAPRSGGRLPYDALAPSARRSGVLVLLYPQHDELYLPLILRPTYEGTHSGQVSFPGGRFEEGDRDIVATALREAQEEVGVDPQRVKVLGTLTPLNVFVSNNLVTPVVAWSEQRPDFAIDEREVAKLLEVPLQHLLDPTNHKMETWQLRDRAAEVPFYAVAEQQVWGATAMMLSEFLALPSFATLQVPSRAILQ